MTTSVSFARRRALAVGVTLVALGLGLGLVGKAVVDSLAPTSPTTGTESDGGGPSGGGPSGGGDGEIPPGERVAVDDVTHPALANLDPELLAAIQRAAADAAREDVEFVVTSGWRSPEYQARLLSEAVRVYGSLEEARRWVASPETSLHVSGDAIDIGDFDATYWLSLHGAAYGLCQTYANERWHFELRPEAVSHGCPEQFLDPTHDPRLQEGAG